MMRSASRCTVVEAVCRPTCSSKSLNESIGSRTFASARAMAHRTSSTVKLGWAVFAYAGQCCIKLSRTSFCVLAPFASAKWSKQPVLELRNAKTYSAVLAFGSPFKNCLELLVRRVVFIEDYPSLVAGT